MTNKNNISSELDSWFKERPKWLQYATEKLLQSEEPDVSELADLCQQETNNKLSNKSYSILTDNLNMRDLEKIHLHSISEVTGVNKLAPRKPLDFSESNLTVVYGNNGSGKSGYVRLLKHICGARDCVREDLHGNVFLDTPVTKKAKVTFLKDTKLEEYKWTKDGVCNELRSVDIFDSSFDSVFIKNAGEVCFEPPLLSFFNKLINICDEVAKELNAKKDNLKPKIPKPPPHLSTSYGIDWFTKINHKTRRDEIDSNCSFTKKDETKLNDLEKRLSAQFPAEKAKQLQNKKGYTDDIIKDVKQYLIDLSDEKCKQIIEYRKQVILKKSAADAVAKKLFSNAPLEGIGSDIWKELWNSARKYSEKVAYKTQEFPVTHDDSVCVLCHQPLSKEAKERFTSFELFIKERIEEQLTQAERRIKQAIDALPNIPNKEELKTKVDAAGIESQDVINALNNTVSALNDRKIKLSLTDIEDNFIKIDSNPPWIEEMQKISTEYRENSHKYLKDASENNRNKLQEKRNDLLAKKWLSEQEGAIQEEIKRIQNIYKIEEAIRITNTKALSSKKGELTQKLITDDFVNRFNQELTKLSLREINVKLAKIKISKGKVLHTLQLNNREQGKVTGILSEGEYRIVSIAAFLADVTGKNYPSPFVFDDPISSLDQDYEEAVVKRLCSIASERQVIIFTHRLSLLGLTQEHAKNNDIKIICIREEAWGTGEPGDASLQSQKPKKALNILITDKIPELRNILNENGSAAYEKEAKYICSEFRILLERMIEHELMLNIVQRHRKAINTMGKIKKLAKISEKDCTYFDDLMTKYSSYLHSPPSETPIQIPTIEALEHDFNKLKKWLTEFNIRCRD